MLQVNTMSAIREQIIATEPDERSDRRNQRAKLSVVTPAYNEERNVPVLYAALNSILSSLDADWEWIVVDDHSADKTFEAVTEIALRDPRVRAVRLARNFGSHTALACGLHQAQGDCAVVLAADLQDPPETVIELLKKWQEGAQVVWAIRGKRAGERRSRIAFARLYYFLMRRVVGMKGIPSTGADFFLLDRIVMDAFRQFRESNVSILALITWMGYRQTAITYDKQSRLYGQSSWNFEKKLKLAVDSVTSFSYLPIRLISCLGFILGLLGFMYAGLVINNALHGNPVPGWSSLMVVVLLVGGIQMLMMGVLGEYLWRALDESRRRPRYLIEASIRLPSVTTDGPVGA